jgi:hypothetical protein
MGIYQDETPKADVETSSKAVLIGPEAKTFGSLKIWFLWWVYLTWYLIQQRV